MDIDSKVQRRLLSLLTLWHALGIRPREHEIGARCAGGDVAFLGFVAVASQMPDHLT
ncbi:hypothetical protein [Caballeronia sp. dw_19]|uniref:hypothetical protein n=1 Tax=Caballeronia sp. dw_19 TaxID=2719791 RepID=UPI001BD6C18B|nr:hypothetical protein [Caballeronia sp. dw_19]